MGGNEGQARERQAPGQTRRGAPGQRSGRSVVGKDLGASLGSIRPSHYLHLALLTLYTLDVNFLEHSNLF